MAQGAAVSHSVNNPGVCRTVTSMTVTYVLNTSSHQSRDSTIICTKKCACAHTPTCQSADSYRSHHMKPSTRSVMGACHPRIAVSPAISGFWVLPLRSCRQLVALALVGYCLSPSPWRRVYPDNRTMGLSIGQPRWCIFVHSFHTALNRNAAYTEK